MTTSPLPPVAPVTFATLKQRESYVAAIKDRVDPESTPLVYLSVPPVLQKEERYADRILPKINKTLDRAKIQDFESTFGTMEEYKDQWEQTAQNIDGLVVVMQKKPILGPGAVREIKAAVARELPILVWGTGGHYAFIDCNITACIYQTSWSVWRLQTPANFTRHLPSYRSTIIALGGTPKSPVVDR